MLVTMQFAYMLQSLRSVHMLIFICNFIKTTRLSREERKGLHLLVSM